MSTDLPEGSSQELVLVSDPEEMIAVLTGAAEVKEHDPAETSAAIIRAILTAETAEDAMKDAAIYNTEDLVGVPFTVNDVKVAKSKYGKDGRGGYLICYIVRHDTGEVCIFTTSSAKVAARILWFQMHSMLPASFKVRAPIETGSGFTVYDVESA